MQPNTASITAFVVGATGYTGREVVAQLERAGHRAVAHVRPDSPRLDEWRGRFAEVDDTPWDESEMTRTLASIAPDVVFALVGTTKKRGDTYEAVDYGLTALLVRAAVRSKRRPRIVYLSSAGAKPGSRNAYLQARWKAEEVVRDSGLAYVIARPSFITGSDRDDTRTGERLGAAAADAVLGVARLFGGGQLRARYRSTTNVVLAGALIRWATDPDATAAVVESEDLR